jgi:hypothetical protein
MADLHLALTTNDPVVVVGSRLTYEDTGVHRSALAEMFNQRTQTNGLALEDAIDGYLTQAGLGYIIRILKDYLEKPGTVSPAWIQLVLAPITWFVNFSWNDNVYQACSEVQVKADPVSREADIGYLREGTKRVINLRGIFSMPDMMLVGRSDLAGVSNPRNKHHLIWKFAAEKLATHPVVFLGMEAEEMRLFWEYLIRPFNVYLDPENTLWVLPVTEMTGNDYHAVSALGVRPIVPSMRLSETILHIFN